MPRVPRGRPGGLIHHVLNRGNARATVFHREEDYSNFLRLLAEAREKFQIRLYAFALMPNHFHAVMRDAEPGAERGMSAMMHWWMTSFVRRQHQARETTGHLWQGRFKSFAVQEDEHLLTVLRYVLLNPVRAGLVRDAFEWPWTSLRAPGLVDAWPLRPPGDLPSWLAYTPPKDETEELRGCVRKRRPFGDAQWQQDVAPQTGYVPPRRKAGRPRLRPEVESALALL
jgi:putative transposase